MRYLANLLVIGVLAILPGCRTSKMAIEYPVVKMNQDLSHWIETDSVPMMKRGAMDSKIGDYNIEHLRDKVNKDKNTPYFGESIYYMLQDLFKK